MPILNGIQATKAIRDFYARNGVERESQPKIFGITGHSIKDFKKEAIAQGMDNVFDKPLKY